MLYLLYVVLSNVFTAYLCGAMLTLGFLVFISDSTHDKFGDMVIEALLWPINLITRQWILRYIDAKVTNMNPEQSKHLGHARSFYLSDTDNLVITTSNDLIVVYEIASFKKSLDAWNRTSNCTRHDLDAVTGIQNCVAFSASIMHQIDVAINGNQ